MPETIADADDELTVFFHPETLGRIRALRAWLLQRMADGELDPSTAGSAWWR